MQPDLWVYPSRCHIPLLPRLISLFLPLLTGYLIISASTRYLNKMERRYIRKSACDAFCNNVVSGPSAISDRPSGFLERCATYRTAKIAAHTPAIRRRYGDLGNRYELFSASAKDQRQHWCMSRRYNDKEDHFPNRFISGPNDVSSSEYGKGFLRKCDIIVPCAGGRAASGQMGGWAVVFFLPALAGVGW